MSRFYIDTKDNMFVAGWEEVSIVEGTGITPSGAIQDLKRGLNALLDNDAKLTEIGKQLVKTLLNEMEAWE